jgi:PAS domain-containing protein
LTRITLIDPEEGAAHPGQDSLGFRAQEEELALLRGVVAQAPLMIWRETAAGDITWANAAYLIQAGQKLEPGKDLTWPLLRLFDRTAIPARAGWPPGLCPARRCPCASRNRLA